MKTLTNANGQVIGFIQSNGNVTLLLNSKGQVVGRYSITENMTYNAQGGKVGKGNLLTMLLSR